MSSNYAIITKSKNEEVTMKFMRFLFCVSLVGVCFSRTIFSYDVPYKVGRGRYLDGLQRRELFVDIRKNASDDFKKIYFKEIGKLAHFLAFFFGEESIGVRVVEFTEFYGVGPLQPKLSEGEVAYLICFNAHEGIPKKDLSLRKKKKETYYDIWVLSGCFIAFVRDKKSKEYKFIFSGSAE